MVPDSPTNPTASEPIPVGPDPVVVSALQSLACESFGNTLLQLIQRRVCPIDQLVGFVRPSRQPGVALFNVGTVPKRLADSLTQRYLDSYHLMDPTVDEMGVIAEGEARLTRMNPQVPGSSVYKAFFFRHSRLVDRIAILTTWQQITIACHGYRRSPSPGFSGADLAAFSPWLTTLAALLRQHYALRQLAPAGAVRGQSVEPLLEVRQQALSRLSPRERDVMQRLLVGLSTEAIALDLNVSCNTVRTFRKKLYRKLAVTSRFELYHQFRHVGAATHAEMPLAMRVT